MSATITVFHQTLLCLASPFLWGHFSTAGCSFLIPVITTPGGRGKKNRKKRYNESKWVLNKPIRRFRKGAAFHYQNFKLTLRSDPSEEIWDLHRLERWPAVSSSPQIYICYRKTWGEWNLFSISPFPRSNTRWNTFLYIKSCVYKQTRTLKQEQSIPPVKQIEMEMIGKVVEYDRILFSSISYSFPCVPERFISYIKDQCHYHAQPLALQHCYVSYNCSSPYAKTKCMWGNMLHFVDPCR